MESKKPVRLRMQKGALLLLVFAWVPFFFRAPDRYQTMLGVLGVTLLIVGWAIVDSIQALMGFLREMKEESGRNSDPP
jgi:hypothetical protein